MFKFTPPPKKSPSRWIAITIVLVIAIFVQSVAYSAHNVIFALSAHQENPPTATPEPSTPNALPASFSDTTVEDVAKLDLPNQDVPTSAISLGDQAKQLGCDPTKLYEWVYNNIGYEPYSSARKGAQVTLWERYGNDADISMLLVELLKICGYQARYVIGTVSLDAAYAQNWVGNSNSLDIAQSMLVLGGVNASVVNNRLQKPHVWVEFLPSQKLKRIFLPITTKANGAWVLPPDAQPITSSATGWVQLDAALKQYAYKQGANLKNVTGFDGTQWFNEFRNYTAISDTQKAIYGMPSQPDPNDPDDSDSNLSWADYKVDDAATKTQAYLNANPNLTNGDLVGGGFIVQRSFASLPSLPTQMQVVDTPQRFWSLPNAWVATVNMTWSGFANYHIRFSLPLPAVGGQRFTLSYEGFQAQDQTTLDTYSLLGSPDMTTTKAIRLVPVFKLGNAVLARGTQALTFDPGYVGSNVPKTLGVLTMTVQQQNIPAEVRNWNLNQADFKTFHVGETLAFNFGFGRGSQAEYQAARMQWQQGWNALPKNANGTPNARTFWAACCTWQAWLTLPKPMPMPRCRRAG